MIRRWLKRLGLAVVALVAFLVISEWKNLAAFPGLLPAFTAKEHCSCRFVMEQEEAYCSRYSRQYLPITSREVDEAQRRVTVRATGVTRSARWLSTREGCRLEP